MFKKLLLSALVLIFSAGLLCAEWVSGYFRKDGKYVPGYFRSDRNDNQYDNYSYEDNYNPYTGKKGTKNYQFKKYKKYIKYSSDQDE